MNSPIGQLISGRFRVEELIGAGGIGSVYRAIQEPLDRPVALKMLRPDLSESPDLRRRFVREARAVAALAHPNIAMVHDFGVGKDSALFMAMELVEGVSLGQLMMEQPSFEVLADVFDQILTGLAHAHAKGIIHRDIKPANVLVARDDDGAMTVKIVDFGIAVLAGVQWEDERTTGVGQVIGTPQYMAPEQARGERHVAATADVYAVGLMLFRAVTGRDAFDGENPMDVLVSQVHDPPPAIVFRPGLNAPAELRELIQDALKKSPRDRVPSANAFRVRLRRILGQQTSPRLARRASDPLTVSTGNTIVEDALTITFDSLKGEPENRRTLAEDAPEVSFSGSAWPIRATGTGVVGREAELQRLVDAAFVSANTNRRGLLIMLDGEAGLGKSRLAAAIREDLVEHGAFRGAHGAFHREGERGLRGIREAFDGLVGTRDAETDRVPALVAERLKSWGMDSESDAALLAQFLRPTVPQPGLHPLASGPEPIFELLFRILTTLTPTRPVVITLDDMQWAGPEAEAFLEFFAAEMQQRPLPVIIVATAHVGEVETNNAEQLLRQLSRFDGHTVLRHQVEPLTEAGSREALATMIHADEELEDALVARGSGNPLHLVQLVRFLRDERLIESTPSGWRALQGVDVRTILPPSLADIMQLRIGQLEQIVPGSRLRDLFARCAVLGSSFRFSVLERMLQIEARSDLMETIDSDIDALLDEDFLQMRPTRRDDVLSFPSSLVRDALLEQMKNRRTTRSLHAFAAEAKLAVLGSEVGDHAEEFIRHYAEARDEEHELEYLGLGADLAERGQRPHDAARYLQRMLELLDGPQASEDRTVQVQVGIRLAMLWIGLGAYAAARDHLNAVLAEPSSEPLARTKANLGIAKIDRILGKFEEARDRYESALKVAAQLEAPELTGDGLLGLARVEWHVGRSARAEELATEALRVARSGEIERLIPEAIWLLGDVLRARGETTEARRHFDEAMALFEARHDEPGRAKCYARLAVTFKSTNELGQAHAAYEEARKIYSKLGDRKGVAHQLNGQGDVARFRAEFAQAADFYRRAVDIFHVLELPYDAAVGWTNLGIVAMESHRDVQAEEAFRRALDVAQRVGFAYLQIGIGLNLAYLLGRLGRDSESESVLAESLELADSSALIDPDYARPLERLADVYATQGQANAGQRLLKRAREMWRELGRDDDLRRVEAQLGDNQEI
ncbi:MAG: serine/threonine protein kinase/tetratricopeptide (TPR) repeat protein [Bradymonadia bacterium]|jgi:serine/threonine protein kinase/tetratricopeptide (TPR) repeat protein